MKRTVLLILFCAMMILPIHAQTDPQESNDMSQSTASYTYHQPTGNRFVSGTGSFPNVTVTDYQMEEVPEWVVMTPDLLIKLTDGRTQLLENNVFNPIDTDNNILPIRQDGLFLPRASDGALWSHSVALGDDLFADIARSGEIVLLRGTEEISRLALSIQDDARIVVSEDGRLAVYANATNERYVHAIMGDDIEGASLVVLQVIDDALQIINQVDLEGDAVYEGLSPMWVDVNQDGTQDLITTVSDSQVGSRIRVYLFSENGLVTVDGQAIGQPNRWQHQLAWGAFGASGEMQLVEVLTPHIGGVVRFYEFDGTNLSIVSQLRGYTSHVIGSRNLDMAVAGDFNGDGQPEIVLPSQDRSRIAGIANTADGAVVQWELPLDGVLTTNLSAINTDNGLVLAVGTSNGIIRVLSSHN